jgi:hypothetical protein
LELGTVEEVPTVRFLLNRNTAFSFSKHHIFRYFGTEVVVTMVRNEMHNVEEGENKCVGGLYQQIKPSLEN